MPNTETRSCRDCGAMTAGEDGYCGTCRPSVCVKHPNRGVYARGLCASCYQIDYRRRHRTFPMTVCPHCGGSLRPVVPFPVEQWLTENPGFHALGYIALQLGIAERTIGDHLQRLVVS